MPPTWQLKKGRLLLGTLNHSNFKNKKSQKYYVVDCADIRRYAWFQMLYDLYEADKVKWAALMQPPLQNCFIGCLDEWLQWYFKRNGGLYGQTELEKKLLDMMDVVAPGCSLLAKRMRTANQQKQLHLVPKEVTDQVLEGPKFLQDACKTDIVKVTKDSDEQDAKQDANAICTPQNLNNKDYLSFKKECADYTIKYKQTSVDKSVKYAHNDGGDSSIMLGATGATTRVDKLELLLKHAVITSLYWMGHLIKPWWELILMAIRNEFENFHTAVENDTSLNGFFLTEHKAGVGNYAVYLKPFFNFDITVFRSCLDH